MKVVLLLLNPNTATSTASPVSTLNLDYCLNYCFYCSNNNCSNNTTDAPPFQEKQQTEHIDNFNHL